MKKVALVASVVLALSVNASAQISFMDNFDDGNIDEWDFFDLIGGVTGQPYASVTFPDGAVRIDSPATPDPALGPGAASIRRTDLVFTDFEMSIDILENNSSIGGVFGLGARVQSPFVGYFLGSSKSQQPNPGTHGFFLTRLEGGPQTQLDIAFFDLPEDGNLKLVFRGEGSSLTGELFSLADLSTPIATLTGEDTAYASGYGEIFAASGAPPDGPPLFDAFADVTFDNFSLVAVPEPSSLVLLSWTIVGVLLHWPRHRQ